MEQTYDAILSQNCRPGTAVPEWVVGLLWLPLGTEAAGRTKSRCRLQVVRCMLSSQTRLEDKSGRTLCVR